MLCGILKQKEKKEKSVDRLEKSEQTLMFSAMDWMFPASPNSYVEILIPNVVICVGGAFGKWLGHEGGALMNGISALIKRGPRELPSTPCWHRKDGSLQCKRGLSPEPNHAGTHLSGFQSPELWEINFWCL